MYKGRCVTWCRFEIWMLSAAEGDLWTAGTLSGGSALIGDPLVWVTVKAWLGKEEGSNCPCLIKHHVMKMYGDKEE